MMTTPSSCRLRPDPLPNGDHGVLWAGSRTLAVDRLVPRAELQEALHELPPRAAGEPPTAFVKWQRIRDRAALLVLYDALEAHGVPVHPCRADAVRGWDELSAGAVVAFPGPNVVVRVDTLEGLTDAEPVGGYVNHLWILAHRLHQPVDWLRGVHRELSMELRERVARLPPEAAVRMYHVDGCVLPLLLWLREFVDVIAATLQEYLHLRYYHVPHCRCWHWTLLPQQTPEALVARRFRTTEVMPSFRGAQTYALGEAIDVVPWEELERAGFRSHQDPRRVHMDTKYGRDGTHIALWFGDDVFFYVAPNGERPTEDGIFGARLPRDHTELPQWVLPTLYDYSHGRVSRRDLTGNVDRYLRGVNEHGSDGLRLLRRVHWGLLPLHWRPTRIQDLELRVSGSDSAAAQRRLVDNVVAYVAAAMRQDPRTWDTVRRAAVDLLADLTGIGHDERVTDTD